MSECCSCICSMYSLSTLPSLFSFSTPRDASRLLVAVGISSAGGHLHTLRAHRTRLRGGSQDSRTNSLPLFAVVSSSADSRRALTSTLSKHKPTCLIYDHADMEVFPSTITVCIFGCGVHRKRNNCSNMHRVMTYANKRFCSPT